MNGLNVRLSQSEITLLSNPFHIEKSKTKTKFSGMVGEHGSSSSRLCVVHKMVDVKHTGYWKFL